MTQPTIVHYRSGSSVQCSNDCVCQNGIWLMPCTNELCATHSIGYLKGNKPPNFPVPAIPEIYEWDYQLGILLENTPMLTEDEMWQLYLDSLE